MKKVIVAALMLTALTSTATFAQESVSHEQNKIEALENIITYNNDVTQYFPEDMLNDVAYAYFGDYLVLGSTDFFNYAPQASEAKIMKTFTSNGIEFQIVQFGNNFITLTDDAILYTLLSQNTERHANIEGGSSSDSGTSSEEGRSCRQRSKCLEEAERIDDGLGKETFVRVVPLVSTVEAVIHEVVRLTCKRVYPCSGEQ